MTPDDALDWLQGASGGEAGIVFADFLRCHGHRCIREVGTNIGHVIILKKIIPDFRVCYNIGILMVFI